MSDDDCAAADLCPDCDNNTYSEADDYCDECGYCSTSEIDEDSP